MTARQGEGQAARPGELRAAAAVGAASASSHLFIFIFFSSCTAIGGCSGRGPWPVASAQHGHARSAAANANATASACVVLGPCRVRHARVACVGHARSGAAGRRVRARRARVMRGGGRVAPWLTPCGARPAVAHGGAVRGTAVV
ncbi:Os11g0291800 [Oryza sativa Japonica Group]|jgi:hypothetical protein|uniref:Os11g0291800 protein n=1 Tax=Oryza sativa subsp. japonica TaxID=39947 RepID=A0A0P0Y156_ORYSJ|nr:hypothetical protein EE612_054848 [Oryza sativa]BAT13636.1 Os11g0291800 [Oryza sativa Japonica Group]